MPALRALPLINDDHQVADICDTTQEGLIIKWAVFLGMIVIFTAYTMIGYFHAKRRIRKGLVPLGYHRVRLLLLLSPSLPLGRKYAREQNR